MDRPPEARPALWSPEEDAGRVGIELNGPTLCGQDLRAFSESPRITRTHYADLVVPAVLRFVAQSATHNVRNTTGSKDRDGEDYRR